MRALPSRLARRRFASLGPVVLALAVLAAPPGGRADEPELRTWKDVSNRFKIQARYVGVEGENVLLKKADGSKMQVNLEKLCSADRNYIDEIQKRLADEDPFKPVAAEDPFKPAASPAASAPFTKGRAAAMDRGRPAPAPDARPATAPGGVPAELEPDWSGAQLAGLPPDGDWKVAVPAPADSAASASAGPARRRAVPVPGTTNFFEAQKGFVVNGPGTHALLGYTLDNPKPGITRVVLCDLKAGKPLGAVGAEVLMAPLALSDSGTQVLMRRDEFGFGNADRLELWDLTPQGLARSWAMTPHADVQGGDRDVKWGAFLGPKRFATVGGKGKLVLWDLDPVRPTLTLQVSDACNPAVSPDGKLLAFVADGKVGLLDVEAGQVAALQPMPTQHTPWPALGFSASGRRFACICAGKLYVWNTEDGKLLQDIQLTPIGVMPNKPPTWTDDDHVLVADRFLIDVDSQVKLWEYDGPDAVAPGRDGFCWFSLPARHNQPGALVPARLPQANVQAALKQALADPNFFIVRPGATVSIDASGVADASARGKVVEQLTARLAENQVKVAPGAAVVLMPGVEAGKEEEISYRTMGLGFRTDTFKVRPQISRVKIVYQGKPAWESGSSTLPPFDFAHLGPNESLADHVKKFEKPNYAFFDQVELPRLLARPNPNGSFTLGRSDVSMAGVR